MVETYEYYFKKYGYGDFEIDGCVINIDAMRVSFRNGDSYLHNKNGPAIIYKSGQYSWWYNGGRHRLDGPAYVENARSDWYINGKLVTIEITHWAKEQGIDLKNLTEDDKILIKLAWSDYRG